MGRLPEEVRRRLEIKVLSEQPLKLEVKTEEMLSARWDQYAGRVRDAMRVRGDEFPNRGEMGFDKLFNEDGLMSVAWE